MRMCRWSTNLYEERCHVIPGFWRCLSNAFPKRNGKCDDHEIAEGFAPNSRIIADSAFDRRVVSADSRCFEATRANSRTVTPHGETREFVSRLPSLEDQSQFTRNNRTSIIVGALVRYCLGHVAEKLGGGRDRQPRVTWCDRLIDRWRSDQTLLCSLANDDSHPRSRATAASSRSRIDFDGTSRDIGDVHSGERTHGNHVVSDILQEIGQHFDGACPPGKAYENVFDQTDCGRATAWRSLIRAGTFAPTNRPTVSSYPPATANSNPSLTPTRALALIALRVHDALKLPAVNGTLRGTDNGGISLNSLMLCPPPRQNIGKSHESSSFRVIDFGRTNKVE